MVAPVGAMATDPPAHMLTNVEVTATVGWMLLTVTVEVTVEDTQPREVVPAIE